MSNLTIIVVYHVSLAVIAQFNLVASAVIWLLSFFPLIAYLAANTLNEQAK